MGIQVHPATDTDFLNIFTVLSRAFDRNEPTVDVLFPAHWTAEGRERGAQRLRRSHASEPYVHFLKAVDDDSGEVVGMAKWYIHENSFPRVKPEGEGAESLYEDAEDKKWAKEIAALVVQDRHDALRARDGNLVGLEILAVDPAHQRRGVGHALVRWGTEQADRRGFDAVVESSAFGRGLYEQHGFVFQKQVALKPGENPRNRPTGEHAWMVRPRRTAPAVE